MHSAIYQGVIIHQRQLKPVRGFRYPLFMVYLDLDEIEDFFALSKLWSVERFNWASFHREDYLNPSVTDLKEAVTLEIKQQTGIDFQGSIRMLSHVRYFGLCFNPATFYFCFNSNNELEYVVTDVTNTPWNERHTYVLTARELADKHTTTKQFHVSPFLDLDMEYRWSIRSPSDNMIISITNLQNGSTAFSAILKMERLEATGRNLNAILAKFPAVTLKTVTGIYWQALKLWLRGAPFYNNPNTSEDHTP